MTPAKVMPSDKTARGTRMPLWLTSVSSVQGGFHIRRDTIYLPVFPAPGDDPALCEHHALMVGGEQGTACLIARRVAAASWAASILTSTGAPSALSSAASRIVRAVPLDRFDGCWGKNKGTDTDSCNRVLPEEKRRLSCIRVALAAVSITLKFEDDHWSRATLARLDTPGDAPYPTGMVTDVKGFLSARRDSRVRWECEVLDAIQWRVWRFFPCNEGGMPQSMLDDQSLIIPPRTNKVAGSLPLPSQPQPLILQPLPPPPARLLLKAVASGAPVSDRVVHPTRTTPTVAPANTTLQKTHSVSMPLSRVLPTDEVPCASNTAKNQVYGAVVFSGNDKENPSDPKTNPFERDTQDSTLRATRPDVFSIAKNNYDNHNADKKKYQDNGIKYSPRSSQTHPHGLRSKPGSTAAHDFSYHTVN